VQVIERRRRQSAPGTVVVVYGEQELEILVPGLQPRRVDALDIDADDVELVRVGFHHPRCPEGGGVGDVEDAVLACVDGGEEGGEVEFVAQGEDVDCAVQDLGDDGESARRALACETG